jgi:hypothetical protein
MSRVTPLMAKNTIKRSLRSIVDRELTESEKSEIWQYYSAKCAYCGKTLAKAGREGHIDHLVPTTSGGTNHISNRVLSCPQCNGDEKREEEWQSFLNRKISDRNIREERIQRIKDWVAKHSHGKKPIDENILQRHIDDVFKAFDTAVVSLKG